MQANDDFFFKMRDGTLESYKAIFKKYYTSLCSFAFIFVHDEDTSRDLVQDVFVNLWKKREDYANVSSIKSLLFVSVRNACYNFIRDNKLTYLDEFPSELLDKQLYNNIVLETETIKIINRAINQLPPQSFKIMKLVLDGNKNGEIAEKLNISVNTVKTLKYNALKVLRVKLKGYYFFWLLFVI